jgi:hypothetical protein
VFRRGFITLIAAAAVMAVAPAVASAGQVGVTVSIQGSGSTSVVEGSIENGATGSCNWTSNKDDRVTRSCTRFRNEEALEAWVWLKATASTVPAGHWKFIRWEGCDETRGTGTTQECAVHSAWNNGVERFPKAVFDDEKAPTVSAVTETFSAAVDKRVTWSFSTDEGQLQCRFDAEVVFTNCSSGTVKDYPTEGQKSLEIRAIDASGQISGTSSRSIWVLDTALTGGPANGSSTDNRSATFTFGTGAGDGFMCALDAAAFAPCAGGSKTYSGLADGSHTFRVYATRTGGWYDRMPAAVTWSVDGPPDTILAPGIGPAENSFTTLTTAAFSFTSSEPSSTFECRLVPQPFTVCALPFALTGLATGAKKFQVRAKDPAGHYDPTPAERNWNVAVDNDGDGYTAPSDCDDADKSVNPGAAEVVNNDVDENCDGNKEFDRDLDGVQPPADCDDDNAGVNPGRQEILDNDVDENCDGTVGVNHDRDGDGSPRPADCDDSNPAVRPGSFDVPGNALDEDCIDGPALAELDAKLVYAYAKPKARFTKFTALALRGLPPGTKVVTRCAGKRCPKAFTKAGAKGKVSIKPWIRKKIPAGAVLTLTATKPGMIGAVKTLKVRRAKAPTWTAGCLSAGAKRPTACG